MTLENRNTISTIAPAQIGQETGCPPPETLFIHVDGGKIAYDDTAGNGPVVLALPGMGDLRSEYRLIRPILQQAGYRVVTMDVRGFGATSAHWSDYSARAVGRDALALIAHLEAGPAIIMGNSFAAGSALWAAHEGPTQVAGTVLLGPILREVQAGWLARLALKLGLAGPWRTWLWLLYWSSLFPTQKPADHAQIKDAIRSNLREAGRMAALVTMIGLPKSDTTALTLRSRVAALIVMGTRDPDFQDPTAEAHWAAARLGAETVMINGAGHYPHTEMPELVAPELLSFFERVLATPATRQAC